jgi:protein gp37
MAETSKIEWTDATVNFWWGCTKVGPGCDHCYAESFDKRVGGSHWGVGSPRRKIASAPTLISKLNRAGGKRVFIQSMSDLFDMEVELGWFAEAWDHIERSDGLSIQIVTKRISVVEKRLAAIRRDTNWPKHAGLLITVVNQQEADRDIPRLIALKAKLGVPWIGLSVEPMLGRITLRKGWLEHIDWVICGGESGSGARTLHEEWAWDLSAQCVGASIAFFMKQMGGSVKSHMRDIPAGLLVRQFPRLAEAA